MTKMMTVTMPDGAVITMPVNSSGLLSEIYGREIYEMHRAVQKGDVVVDVGANVGVFTLKALFAGAKVIAVEPHPGNVDILMRNVYTNLKGEVIIAQNAIAHVGGKAKLFIHSDSGGHSIVNYQKTPDDWIQVEAVTLDELVKKSEFTNVDFVKIDVEGAEIEVLKGATETLKTKGIHFAIAAYHYKDQLDVLIKFFGYKDFDVKIWNVGTFLGSRFIYATRL